MKRMSKSLLCGVIATSFFIINCQKAPNRPVTAGGTPPPQGNTASTGAMANCTKDILDLIKSQSDLMTAMDALSAKSPVTEDQKTELTAKATQLDTVSKNLKDAITALKVNGQAGIGCNEAMPDKDGKPVPAVPHTLADIDAKKEGVVARASGVTKTRLPGTPDPKLVADTTIVIGADLAGALTDDKNVSKDGKAGDQFIDGGSLKSSGTDGADYKKEEADKTKTSCLITLGNKDPGVDAGAEAKVGPLSSAVINAASKRSQIIVSLTVKDDQATSGNYMLGLTCNVADGQDPATEVRKALGSLITEKAGEPSTTPKSGDTTTTPDPAAPAPKPADPAAPAPAPAPAPAASGDQTSGDKTVVTPDPAPAPAPAPAASGDVTSSDQTVVAPDPAPAASTDPTPASGDTTTAAGRAAQQRQTALLAAQRAQAARQQAMQILTRGQ